jgi:hypothetical protein
MAGEAGEVVITNNFINNTGSTKSCCQFFKINSTKESASSEDVAKPNVKVEGYYFYKD